MMENMTSSYIENAQIYHLKAKESIMEEYKFSLDLKKINLKYYVISIILHGIEF